MEFAALTFNDLGLVPHKLKGYPIEFLIAFRKGGPQFGSTVSEKVSTDDYAWGSVDFLVPIFFLVHPVEDFETGV